jgi:hypothetical protein
MNWDIIVGLIMLLGSAISICTVVANNTKTMTELKCSVDTLTQITTEQKNAQREDSDAIHDILKTHEKHLSQHDIDIALLQKEGTKNDN